MHGVPLRGPALGIVGERQIDLAGLRVGLHVLRPVHRCGPQQVGGAAGFDHHVGLAVEPVFRRQRSGPVHQRHPGEGAVLAEPRDAQQPRVEQAEIRRAVGLVHRPVGDEAVEIVEPLVITHIDDQAAIPVGDAFRALMLEAAQRRALHGRRCRVQRVDFHHPAEAVGLIGLLVDVEAVHMAAPVIAAAHGHAVAAIVPRLGVSCVTRGACGFKVARRPPAPVAVIQLAAEIEVEVLFRHQVAVVRRDAAGAIVQGTDHPRARRVSACLHAGMSGCGT